MATRSAYALKNFELIPCNTFTVTQTRTMTGKKNSKIKKVKEIQIKYLIKYSNQFFFLLAFICVCGRGSVVACVKSCMKIPDRKKNLFPNHQRLRIPLLPFSDVCSAYGTKEADLISSVNAYHLLPLKKKKKWAKSKAEKLSCLLPPFAPHVAHAKSITNKSK